ncbi:tRNA (adenosine(37)-N6)-threonylcarbamoyltransferase complex dimerization subunit type 1 TsaB [Microbulbifer sp.]|uniref:tRNA (adenosine(37)-N6)-threonylcarbamoyltransferase complex dimerization subunit type 1 TsaB n=1 Tax=Microbulbifer sp. TaxID=1908541 RepID=UPI002587A3CF|nr:tRNA (adenosine(37)-N6)-threonylcarbamoyltransferase complex dimerization subunit type 1 TsaB [Microbulbifer sp.]
MKILAIDTTSGACSVALLDGDAVSEQFVQAERDHTRRLLPMVDSILAEGECKLSEIDALAVSRGPGSFTGLRIAVSCVQGLAFAADKPVVPVSSLAALASGARRVSPGWGSSPVVAALDARMQEVYWGVYGGGDPANSLVEESVSAPEQLVTALQSGQVMAAGAAWYAAGPGWHYPGLAPLSPTETVQEFHVHAQDIGRLALELWQRGEMVSAEALEPAYLRNEVTWKKRQRIRQ